MTVAPYTGAPDWSDFGDVGLEDVSAADVRMPRLQINHDTAQFKDSSSGELMGDIQVIILGLIKQRIMWDSEVDDGDKPQCKSPDFQVGYPQLRKDIPARKQFPWANSNFSPADFPPQDDGLIHLPCESCKFSQWGRDKTKPLCSEQFTLPLYYLSPTDGGLKPGILSLQRSGIKNAKTYISTFKTAGQPMFTAWTHLSLRPESRGKVVYAVPQFRRGELSDASQWGGWATGYREVRDWLTSAPTLHDETEDKKTGGARPVPASAKTATALAEDDPWSAPPATAAPSAPVDDDLPF
jgi:hypothetical protein